MSSSGPLTGLPGARGEAGGGPVVPALFEGLLADAAAVGTGPDAAPVAPAAALAEHRAHRAAWYGDLVGPLLVPAPGAAELAGALSDGDLGLRVALVGGPSLDTGELRLARAALEGTRAEVVGIYLPLPPGEPQAAARTVLEKLEASVPVWLELPNRPGWPAALDVLATDGAECAALRLDGPDGFRAEPDLAAVLRLAIDRDVTFAVTAAALPAVREDDPVTGVARHGLLNVLCAVRAALNGAEEEEMVPVLAERDPAPLCSALRRMSDADAAVTRAFLAAVGTRVGASVAELEALGLVEPDAA